MNNTILSTAYVPAQSIISNGVITGTQWTNTQDIFFLDGNVASSASGAGQASDFIIGNFNLNVPQGAVIVGIQMELFAEYQALTSPIATITPYFVDNTSGQNVYYPGEVYTGLTPDIPTTAVVLGGPTYQFNTSLSVDQVNNTKIALVASGGVNVDTFLVQAFYYIPSSVTPPTPPTNNCLDCNSPVQINAMYLALPFNTNDTVFYLQPNSLVYPDGTPFAPGDIGSCGGEIDLVFDQGRQQINGSNFAENVKMPFIEGDSTDSATITILSNGVQAVDIKSVNNRGLGFHTPYAHSSSLQSNHAANSEVVISNNGPFYLRFVRTCQVGIVFSAPIVVLEDSSVITDPATGFNFIGGGVTVVQDISNPEQVNITIPGAGGVQPPLLVKGATVSYTSGNTQVPSITGNIDISGLNRAVSINIDTQYISLTGAIVSATVGGVAATQSVFEADATHGIRTEIWSCVNPPLGMQPIVITLASPSYITFGAELFNQIDTAVVTGATATASGTSLAPSLTLHTNYYYSTVIDSLATALTPILYTPGAGQGLNWDIVANGTNIQGGSSEQPAGTAPDAVTMSYAITQNTPWVYCAVEYKGITSGQPGITSINGATENAQTIVGAGGTTVSTNTGTGVTTIASSGGGSGIVSINGDTTAAQTIVAGAGISIATAAGATTITNTGGSGGSSGLVGAQVVGSTTATLAIPGGTLATGNCIQFEAMIVRTDGTTNCESVVSVSYGGSSIGSIGIGEGGLNLNGGAGFIRGYIFGTGATNTQSGYFSVFYTGVQNGTSRYVFGLEGAASGTPNVDSTMSQDLVASISNISGAIGIVSMVVTNYSI